MPNVMAALLNIGGTICSTPQSLADAHYLTAVQKRCQVARKPLKLAGVPQTPDRSQPLVRRSSPYCGIIWRRYCCLTRFFRCRCVP